jgi:hypothetical protein
VSLAEVNWLAVRAVLANRMRRNWSGLKQAALLENVLVAMFQRQPVSPLQLLPGSDTLTYDWLEQHELGLRYDEHGSIRRGRSTVAQAMCGGECQAVCSLLHHTIRCTR